MVVELVSLLKDKRGVTLVELLVVLAITGIVMIAVGDFFLQGLRGFNLARDEEILHGQASRIIASLDEDIMESSGVASVRRDAGNNITGFTLNALGAQTIAYDITARTVNRIQRDTASGNVLQSTSFGVGNTSAWVIQPVRVATGGAVTVVDVPAFTSGTENDFSSGETLGLQYRITLQLNDAENIIESRVFFRN